MFLLFLSIHSTCHYPHHDNDKSIDGNAIDNDNDSFNSDDGDKNNDEDVYNYKGNGINNALINNDNKDCNYFFPLSLFTSPPSPPTSYASGCILAHFLQSHFTHDTKNYQH